MPKIQHLDFIDYLLKEKILDLLTAIKNIEPTLFTKDDIDDELDKILKKIKMKKLDTKQLSNKISKNNKKKVNKEKVNKEKVKLNKKKLEYNTDNRCHARVWGPIHIIDKQVNYGEQCHKKKNNDSKYCFIHQSKLSHGDYFEKPSIMIKEHFEVNSKIVKTNSLINN